MVTEYLKKTNKRLKKIHTLAEIVKSMDDAEGHDDLTFDSKHRDFLEFLQTSYEDVTQDVLGYASQGGIRQRLDFARQFFRERRVQDIDYGLRHLNSIFSDLGDKLKNVAINFVPIKDTDLDKADDLNGLIDSYKDTIDTLTDNLGNINPQTHPERYDAQQRTIQEYEEFKSLLEDYKPLVKEIIEFKKFYAPFVEQKGRRDEKTMKEIFNKYLDDLAEKYKKEDEDKYDDSIALIRAAKVLSSNPHYLPGYYLEGVLNPAQEKVFAAAEKADLKDYTKRLVGAIDSTKQMQFLDMIYSVSTSEEN